MARALKAVPTFGPLTLLCRHVDCDGGRRRRASYADFLPNPGDDHLSVNSLEVEAKASVAEYYAAAFQRDARPVGICTHSVREYNEVAKKAQCPIRSVGTPTTWEFDDTNGKSAAAYRHRPVSWNANYPFESRSHCGVEFVRALSDLKLRFLARRLAKKKIEHL